MSTSTLLELFGGFAAACFALWFVAMGTPSTRSAPLAGLTAVAPAVKAYLQRPGRLASFGLLRLRLTIGTLMIHHGQEKLVDPQQFANTDGASLHLPFSLFFAYAAGFSALITRSGRPYTHSTRAGDHCRAASPRSTSIASTPRLERCIDPRKESGNRGL
jgi:hypothetical protein